VKYIGIPSTIGRVSNTHESTYWRNRLPLDAVPNATPFTFEAPVRVALFVFQVLAVRVLFAHGHSVPNSTRASRRVLTAFLATILVRVVTGRSPVAMRILLTESSRVVVLLAITIKKPPPIN